MTIDPATIPLGSYLLPSDVTDDPDHTHRLEGVAWASSDELDDDGEPLTTFHVVRVWHGKLAWAMLPAERVGTVAPAGPAELDNLLKLAGVEMKAKGTKVSERTMRMAHTLFEVSRALPEPKAPSIFDPVDDLNPEEEAGWTLRPKLEHIEGEAARKMTEMLVERLERLDKVDHVVHNEIRRASRVAGLTYLSHGADLSLADHAAYDALLTRWERHVARVQAVTS